MASNVKKLISETFISLVHKKDTDKITVKDVVEACGISRQTFYYHFQDILQVIEWTIEQSFQQTFTLSVAKETLEETLEAFLEIAIEKSNFIRRLMKSQQREYIEGAFINNLQEYLSRLFRKYSCEATVNLDVLEIMQCFYTYGTFGVLLKCSEQTQVNTKKIARQLAQLFRCAVPI